MALQEPTERAIECLAWPPPNPQEGHRAAMSGNTAQAQGLAEALRQILGRFIETPLLPTPTTSRAHTRLPLQTLLKSASKKEAQLGENNNYCSISRWHVEDENSPTSKVTSS